jgi:hypothetical protein
MEVDEVFGSDLPGLETPGQLRRTTVLPHPCDDVAGGRDNKLVTSQSGLRLFVDGTDQGVAPG